MNNTKIVYFTRSGNCKRIAESIAGGTGGQLVEVKDNKNWKGFFGFLKGGYYATRNKEVEIYLIGEVGSEDDLVVVSPVWASGMPPAIRMFLKDKRRDDISLVISASGSSVNDKDGFKKVYEISQANGNESEVIDSIIGDLSVGS